MSGWQGIFQSPDHLGGADRINNAETQETSSVRYEKKVKKKAAFAKNIIKVMNIILFDVWMCDILTFKKIDQAVI